MLQDFKLVVFETVVRLGSFTKAAHELDVNQPAVSGAIAELEKQVGRTLLLRGRGSVVPTPEGELFMSYASGITDAYGKMSEAMLHFDENREKVCVYFVPESLKEALDKIIPLLKK